jgi:hypothetical protein
MSCTPRRTSGMLDAADRAAGLRLPPLCPPEGAAVRLYYLPHSAPVIIELAEHRAFTGTCLSSRSSASPKSDFGTDPVSCVPRWMAMDDALKFEPSPIAMSSKASSAHPSRRGPVATSGLRSSAGRPPRGSDAVLTAVAFPWVREPGHRANSAPGPRCPEDEPHTRPHAAVPRLAGTVMAKSPDIARVAATSPTWA